MKGPQDPRQRELAEAYFRSKMQRRLMGGIDRRTFLKGSAAAAAAGLTVVPFTGFKPEAVSAANKVLQDGGNSADAAVAAAQQYSGITLNVVWEEALQLQDPSVNDPESHD